MIIEVDVLVLNFLQPTALRLNFFINSHGFKILHFFDRFVLIVINLLGETKDMVFCL